MKKFKKQIPSILYAVMLLTIAILCIFITNNSTNIANGSDEPTKINPDNLDETSNTESKNDKDTTNNDNSTSIPNDKNDTNDNNDSTNDETIDSPIVKTYNDTVPRNAEASEDFLYKQKIYGNGNTYLKDVFQTSVGTYVIATTDSSSGDICGQLPCTGIIRLDTAGNLVGSLSLDYAYASNYVASAISPMGIIIITAPKTNSFFYVNIISYELDYSTPYRISSAESAKIIPTQNSFLIFAEYSNECVVYSFTGTAFDFQSIGTGYVKELFEYGNFYTVFTNNVHNNSYSITKLSKDKLSLISEIHVENAQIEGVFPVIENKTQNFILLEKNQGIFAKKTDTTFNHLIATKKVGNFTLEGCYQSSDGILLICNGNITGIAIISYDLTTSFTENDSSYIVKDILDSVYTENNLYYLAINNEDLLSVMFSTGNKTSARYFQIKTDFAKLIFNLNNTFTVIYQNGEDIEIFGIPEY